MDCGAKILKYILFIFNFIFFLFGAGILGIGLWIRFDNKTFADVTGTESLYLMAYFLIALGAIIFVIAFCGCCGACSENKCLLGLFSAFLIVIIIIQVAIAIYAGVKGKSLESDVKKGFMETLSKKFIGWPTSLNKSESASLALDNMMVSLKCCGISGPGDFEKKSKNASQYAARWYKDGRVYSLGNKVYKNDQVKLPVSCCRFKDDKFLTNGWKKAEVEKAMVNKECPIKKIDYNKMGCFEKIKKQLSSNIAVVIGILCGVLIFELCTIIFAICLCRSIESD